MSGYLQVCCGIALVISRKCLTFSADSLVLASNVAIHVRSNAWELLSIYARHTDAVYLPTLT